MSTVSEQNQKEKIYTTSVILFFILFFFFSFLFAVSLGVKNFSLINVLDYFFCSTCKNTQVDLLLSLRVPRVLTSFFVGSLLAISGLIFQTIFKNDLATPFTLGVSTASSAGAFLFILFFQSISTSGLSVWIGSFLGGLFEISLLLLIVFYLYNRNRKSLYSIHSNSEIVLAGVALNFLFSGIIMITRFLANPYELTSMEIWILGSLQVLDFEVVFFIAIVSILLLIIYLLFSRKLDYLLLDDNWILSRGLKVNTIKVILIVVSLVVLSYVLSHTGPIGFIGLVIPHLVKKITKETHFKLILYSFFTGGIFLIYIDILSRVSTISSSGEIPVGLLTSLIGAPFFLYILIVKK